MITVAALILLAIFSSSAQNRDLANKLKEWNIHCDKLKGIPTGKENYPALILAARKGLAMTPASNYLYKSLFAFHLGGGFESTYKMDSAVYYYELSKTYAEKINNYSRIVFALRRLAGLYDNMQNTAKGNEARNYLIEIGKKDKDEEIQVGVNIVLGEYYFNSGQFEKALESYLEYIHYLKKDYERTANSASKSNIGVGMLAIGELYQKLNRYPESLNYFKESLSYLDNYQEGMETGYRDLVSSYLATGHIDSSLKYYSFLKTSVLKSNNKTVLLNAQIDLGNYYLKHGHIQAADAILSLAVQNAKFSKEKEDSCNVKIAIGDLALKKNQPEKALQDYTEALPLALYFKNKATIAGLYFNMGQAQKTLHLPEEAFKSIVLYAKYQDSLKSESISKNIMEMEARFQNEIKQQKIGLLNKENSIALIRLQQEQRMRWGLAIAVFLSLLIAGMVYRNYKVKQKANLQLDKKNHQLDLLNAELTTANETKAKLFSIISHDLRSPINEVYQFLRVQRLRPERLNNDQRTKLNDKIQDATSSLLETMEDLLLWSKTQMSHFSAASALIPLNPIVEKVKGLLQLNLEGKVLTLENHLQKDLKVNTDAYFLQIILHNLLQNAIKAAPFESAISIGFVDSNADRYLFIHNEGMGFTQEQYRKAVEQNEPEVGLSGLGLRLVDELSKKISISIEFMLLPTGKGTEVRVWFPFND